MGLARAAGLRPQRFSTLRPSHGCLIPMLYLCSVIPSRLSHADRAPHHISDIVSM